MMNDFAGCYFKRALNSHINTLRATANTTNGYFNSGNDMILFIWKIIKNDVSQFCNILQVIRNIH